MRGRPLVSCAASTAALRLRVAAAFWPRIEAAERGLDSVGRALLVAAGAGVSVASGVDVSVVVGAALSPLEFVSVAMCS